VGLVSPPAKKPGHGISVIGVLWRHVGFFSPAISGTGWRVATWILRVHFGGENKTDRPPASLPACPENQVSQNSLTFFFYFISFLFFQFFSSLKNFKICLQT
jgi:hypothetical protein